jgi:hypothetical protein
MTHPPLTIRWRVWRGTGPDVLTWEVDGGWATASLASSPGPLARVPAAVTLIDGLTHVTAADGSLVAALAGERVLYARTTLWGSLRVEGGRYEVCRDEQAPARVP